MIFEGHLNKDRERLDLSSIYDDDYFITEIGMPHIFPNPREASDEGLMAYGGDLDPNRLLKAYRNGIFPWFNEGDPIFWWSPNPRLLLIQMSLRLVNL